MMEALKADSIFYTKRFENNYVKPFKKLYWMFNLVVRMLKLFAVTLLYHAWTSYITVLMASNIKLFSSLYPAKFLDTAIKFFPFI